MSWSPGFEHPALPSPGLREHYEREVLRRFEGAERIDAALVTLVLDGLGDLALGWALKPLRAWQGKSEELAKKIAADRAWPEATAIIEVGAKVGLLVPTEARDHLRPVDPGVFTWLAARRVAETSDRDGLMDYRLNGGLFDVFAMAAAIVAEPERGAGLVQLMAESPGPFEELLELGPALAAAAVAWGAPASPELRLYLSERALAWTQPMGADWNREVGTALLALECQRHEEREQLANVAIEIVSEIVQVATSDHTLVESPPILATLDTALAMLVAPGLRRGAAGALPREVVELLENLPVGYRHRVGLVLGRLMPPGPVRDEALVAVGRRVLAEARRTGEAGLPVVGEARRRPGEAGLPVVGDDVRAVRVLARCELATPVVDAWLAELVAESAARPAVLAELVEVLRAHRRCPSVVVPALVAWVRTGRPEQKVRAASVLAYAEVELGGLGGELEAFFLREDISADDTAGAVGALLWLGGRHPRLLPAALALIASELPEGLTQVLAEACDWGLRSVPEHVGELVAFYRAFGSRPGVAKAVLKVGEAVASTSQRARDLGAFAGGRDAPGELAAVLLELAADPSEPVSSAEAAVVCASLMQGDETLVQALVTLRAGATEPRARALYDLALGASRALTPDVLERLGRDAATADPEVAAAACVALRLGVETFVQAASLDAWVPRIRARVEESGPHDVPALQLVAHLATAPLGVDPR